MRALAPGAALTSVLLLGCGAPADQAAPSAEPSTSASEEPPSPSSSSPSSAPSSPSDPAAAGGAPTVLRGAVGTPEDPDAFVITLTDEAGQPVTTVPAGSYRIQVDDPSEIHNFHLLGGAVDATTTVPEVVQTTFDVTLEPGEYTYVCDPHPRMVGELAVT